MTILLYSLTSRSNSIGIQKVRNEIYTLSKYLIMNMNVWKTAFITGVAARWI